MLKTGLVAVALIGCDCDARMCEYISAAPEQWASVADCEANLQSRIVQQHETYPLVIAVCRPDDTATTVAKAPDATAEAAGIAAPILAEARAGTVSSDASGRLTTLFGTLGGYVSIRDSAITSAAGTAWSGTAQRALDAMAWLRAAALPGN